MADPQTSTLRLTQPLVGGDSGAWATLLNSDLAYIDAGVNGMLTIPVGGQTTYTLEAAGDAGDQARYAWYNFTGVLTANCTVTIPANQKIGIIKNGTTGGFNIVLTTGSGNSLTVSTASIVPYYCDGTNVVLLPWGGTSGGGGSGLTLPYIAISANTTVTAAQSGSFFYTASSAAFTVTLPAPVGINGVNFTFYNPENPGGTGYPVTLVIAGGQQFFHGGGVPFQTTSVVMPAGNTAGSFCTVTAFNGGYVISEVFGMAGAFSTLTAVANDALLYASGGQTIPANSLTVVTGWSAKFDRNGTNFNAASGFFTAPVNGYYQVSFSAILAAGSNMTLGAYWINGLYAPGSQPTVPNITSVDYFTRAGQQVGKPVTAIVYLKAGYTIAGYVQHNSASSLTNTGIDPTGGYPCYFSVAQIP